ncbi:MAG TPA: histidine--tRNA ligase [Rhodospirillaceae bacterium]|nr:histidine--tRNA ligase [Rhodospirillaceae bacterium]
MMSKRITKPSPISGFPEWLPQVRRAEQMWFDHIRTIFEQYGFCPIETPSVEALDILNAKGEDEGDDVDKEVYVIERLHKEDGDKEARLALHFDQTVPLARYTAQHYNELVFPFKRYQMQRVWRGERPQAGRFREFYQCDIDVIGVDTLPAHFDAEMPAIIWEVLASLPGMEDEKIQIQISNRKILIGLLQALGVTNIVEATRIIDKLDKLPENEIRSLLNEQIGMAHDACETVLKLATIKATDSSFAQRVYDLGIENDMMREGVEELSFVMDQLAHIPTGGVVADLSIVRGLDYYTGTVYETRFVDDPTYGSICSGGRYDDLASNYINRTLPGVGISIGFSRLFDRIRQKQQLPALGISPADIMVIMPSEDRRAAAQSTAHTLRQRGFNVEVFHSGSKLKRQMAYAEKKGIPYVWFPPFDDSGESKHEIKKMTTGEQASADPESWTRD